MSDRKLTAWQAAGLIDGETAARIRDYENTHSRPLALWSLIGIGALAIGLGLISVVAANWDDIPGIVRLAVHMLLMVTLAVYMAFKLPTQSNDYFNDALIFILGALGLTFLGHLGQVYQTSSPLWQPLALWMLLFSPIMLGMGRGWTVALMWIVGLNGTSGAHLDYMSTKGTLSVAYQALIFSPLILTVVGALFWRERSQRPDFWRRLANISLSWALIGVSFTAITAPFDPMSGNDLISVTLMQSLILFIGAAAIYMMRLRGDGVIAAQLLALSGLIIVGVAVIGTSAIGAAVLFILLWSGVAACALIANVRWLFQVAVAIIALRLVVLSFELANDLLGSGIGLILVGLLTLGIAWAALTISRRFAPKVGDAA